MAKKGKEKQCIAICKDVIEQIDAGKYIPISRNYLNSTGGKGEDNPFQVGDLQPQIKERKKPCGVCAIASLFLSRVRIYNAFEIPGWRDWQTGLTRTPDMIYSDLMTVSLETYFTALDLAYIEATYESLPNFVEDIGESAKSFRRSPLKKLKRLIKDDGERMKWIMRHIIRNKGSFNVKNAEKAAARLK